MGLEHDYISHTYEYASWVNNENIWYLIQYVGKVHPNLVGFSPHDSWLQTGQQLPSFSLPTNEADCSGRMLWENQRRFLGIIQVIAGNVTPSNLVLLSLGFGIMWCSSWDVYFQPNKIGESQGGGAMSRWTFADQAGLSSANMGAQHVPVRWDVDTWL
jgi:hypothetical protein